MPGHLNEGGQVGLQIRALAVRRRANAKPVHYVTYLPLRHSRGA